MKQITGISISDWSGIVAMLVSLCALVSPVLTTLCNNWHQRRMKRMEYEHQEQMERQKYEREIYEGYIRSAGAAIRSPTEENLREYGSHSALAAYYVTPEIQKDILEMDKLISYDTSFGNQLDEKVNLLSKIVTAMRTSKEPRS